MSASIEVYGSEVPGVAREDKLKMDFSPRRAKAHCSSLKCAVKGVFGRRLG